MKLFLGFLALFILLAGCSVAPINTATTARTLGEGKNLLTGSFPVTGVKYERGITNDLDLGLGIENQFGLLFHAFGKVNFINHQENGFSVGSLFGGGLASIGDSKSFYTGPIVSYRKNSFEVFTAYKFNFVQWKFDGIDPDDKDDLLSVPSSKNDFTYHEFDLGMNFIEGRWMFTVGAHLYIFPDTTSSLPFVDIAYGF